MLELLCKIPDHIGWMLVGMAAMACAFALYKLGALFVEMWRDWHEDETEEESF